MTWVLPGVPLGPSEVWSQSCSVFGGEGVVEVALVPPDLDDLVQEQLVVARPDLDDRCRAVRRALVLRSGSNIPGRACANR